MTPKVSLPWKLSLLHSLSAKNKISSFSNLKSETEGPAWNWIGTAHILLNIF